ncbi:unnamed protein product [Phytophthora lilii]|uniref:Unnamed protein product n=1 Tax=Phytophthora lilii TaxID=2077276 RepID=A0A9W6WVL1_9STRA|nr:unnamed protein product [Phytophthora lilii]
MRHIVKASAPEVETIDTSLNDLVSPAPVLKASFEHNVESGEKTRKLVLQGLQLLFHCEYLVLVGYVECAVPLVYVVYKVILEHLPNVAYYPGGAGNFGSAAVANILVLALLEIGSLLLLNLFLKRKFGLSSIYQLAFVLETQKYLVQGNLFVETLFLLQFELEHFYKHHLQFPLFGTCIRFIVLLFHAQILRFNSNGSTARSHFIFTDTARVFPFSPHPESAKLKMVTYFCVVVGVARIGFEVTIDDDNSVSALKDILAGMPYARSANEMQLFLAKINNAWLTSKSTAVIFQAKW